jgi:hypothetical protein
VLEQADAGGQPDAGPDPHSAMGLGRWWLPDADRCDRELSTILTTETQQTRATSCFVTGAGAAICNWNGRGQPKLCRLGTGSVNALRSSTIGQTVGLGLCITQFSGSATILGSHPPESQRSRPRMPGKCLVLSVVDADRDEQKGNQMTEGAVRRFSQFVW